MTSPGDTSLPRTLRRPMSRNVALLLESRIPARLAWSGAGGAARVVPIWFHWTGAELAMATFAGASKLDEITDGDHVAVTIDTESFPYRSLRMGGPVTLRRTEDIASDYRLAATRYLGPQAGDAWCRSLTGRAQVVLMMRPTWARATDMHRSPFLSEPG